MGHPAVPLQSPLGVWTITASEVVGVDKCKAVRFEFDVFYRVGATTSR